MEADSDKLLFVMSARQKMSWSEFSEAVDFLLPTRSTKIIDRKATILHALQALGHCDVYRESDLTKIIIAPPALYRLPRSGVPVAVLAGMRGLDIKEQLFQTEEVRKGDVEIKIEKIPDRALMPDVIQVRGHDEILQSLSDRILVRYINTPPAWSLANWSATLAQYAASLTYTIDPDLNWSRYDFSEREAEFERLPSETVPRLSRYFNPTTRLPKHVFFAQTLGAEVDLDWGRYLILNSAQRNIVRYDKITLQLHVPLKMQLPALMARSICLSSGRPPVYTSGETFSELGSYNDWLTFQSVPPQIARLVLLKLGQASISFQATRLHKSF